MTAKSLHRSNQSTTVSELAAPPRPTQQPYPPVQSQLVQSTARSSLAGPVAGKSYTYRDQFDLVSANLSPCGANTVLNINSDVRVSNSGNTKGSGYFATDSIDTSLATVSLFYNLFAALLTPVGRPSTSTGKLARSKCSFMGYSCTVENSSYSTSHIPYQSHQGQKPLSI